MARSDVMPAACSSGQHIGIARELATQASNGCEQLKPVHTVQLQCQLRASG
jgi:hypothetical protein